MRRSIVLAFLAMLAACGPAAPPTPIAPPPQAGLDRVMGKDRQTLTSLFGEPQLDIREGPARKLQFTGPICVLDAYLYPPSEGKVPITTYIDTRRPTGEDFDRASCIAALARRPGAR